MLSIESLTFEEIKFFSKLKSSNTSLIIYKDILKSLICNDNVQTKIFYLNDKVHARQVANLVKVIGPDELIKRTGGPTKTIEFIRQK